MKSSTRQRMVSIELDFPPPEIELEILCNEVAVERELAENLIRLGQTIRRVNDAGLREAASTRTLIAAAALIAEGLRFHDAAVAAIAGPLTDDVELRQGLIALIDAHAPMVVVE
jgi:nitric oxide reductase NorQ protein